MAFMKIVGVAVLGMAVLSTLPLRAEELKLGKPISIESATPIKDILARPDQYLGKHVRIEGEIVEVCQNMGCWINIKQPGTNQIIQVKVNDGEIVFPKDGAGRMVIAQGKLERVLVSKEELQRQAEESGKRADPSAITEGKMIYRIKGEGAVVR
jgi:RecJ-like exonuclease